jgi:hypothetical protein
MIKKLKERIIFPKEYFAKVFENNLANTYVIIPRGRIVKIASIILNE